MVNKYELVNLIEKIAPSETAESWDMSGWLVETANTEVQRVMLCLTITNDIISQAKEQNCDMIISHHPLFYIPLNFNCGLNIYCAHTNLDKALHGTTETLIQTLGLTLNRDIEHDFLRFCDIELAWEKLLDKLQPYSKNIRYTNPQNIDKTNRIAFCAGSGTEFWHDAYLAGADVLITGDLKFHTAIDSEIAIIDIGHFESEILVLKELANILHNRAEIIFAEEKSPITQINS